MSPRGGSRAGSGRKPDPTKRPGTVVDFPGLEPSPAAPSTLLEPPSELAAAIEAAEKAAGATSSPDSARVVATLQKQATLWRQFAPLAIDQGTLTPLTVPGFRELCEQLVLKEELAAKLARFGMDGENGRARLKDYTRFAQRVDASLARFKLTAFGKPDDVGGGAAAAKKTAVNPWAQAR